MDRQERGNAPRLAHSLSAIVRFEYLPLGDRGEDAHSFSFEDDNLHAMAVFDGCGGAGAWPYPEYSGATGAFVAAQTMAQHFLPWLKQSAAGRGGSAQALANSFGDAAGKILAHEKAKCAPMGVSGSLVKSFPCTASVAVMTQGPGKSIHLASLNAGDSRVYFLTPSKGLVQMTQDDSRGNPDPLESLQDSAPLSNLLNGDKPFRVRGLSVDLPMPCAVFCATDGTFGFLRSPMDFEYLLLSSMTEARSIEEFERRMLERIKGVTGDDSTLLGAFYGWQSFEGLRADFGPRLAALREIISAMDKAGARPEEAQDAIQRCWDLYKRDALFEPFGETRI